MENLFYYQPVIRAVAKNGSERLGVNVVTQIWSPDKPRKKMDLSVYGETSEIALEKLRWSTKTKNSESVELPCEYYLCSASVVAHFKPFEVSKPFKSGYEQDDDLYYVAWLNFEEVDKFYKEVLKEETDFWCRECVPGTMDSEKISMKNAKKIGLFLEIAQKLDITTERNQAMTIRNLSNKHSCTPVQLINKFL